MLRYNGSLKESLRSRQGMGTTDQDWKRKPWRYERLKQGKNIGSDYFEEILKNTDLPSAI